MRYSKGVNKKSAVGDGLRESSIRRRSLMQPAFVQGQATCRDITEQRVEVSMQLKDGELMALRFKRNAEWPRKILRPA